MLKACILKKKNLNKSPSFNFTFKFSLTFKFHFVSLNVSQSTDHQNTAKFTADTKLTASSRTYRLSQFYFELWKCLDQCTVTESKSYGKKFVC